MQIKDTLNQFEADWAAMPTVEKDKLNMLKNKTIAVYGNSLAKCLCYSLMYLNDNGKLNTKILIFANDINDISSFNQKLLLRKDFEFVSFSSADTINKIDYIVYTGICSEPNEYSYETFSKEISASKVMSQLAIKHNARTILLSDSRIYGNSENHRVYSENEYASISFSQESNFACQIMRTVEEFWNCANAKNNFQLSILRTGIILGACSNIYNGLENVFEAVANGKNCELSNSNKKISFTYISDVFRAIIYGLTTLDTNTTYNVTSIDSTVSTSMLTALLKDIFENKCNITFSDNNSLFGCAINANKIICNGCAPKTDIKTALTLCVLSYTNYSDSKPLVMPNTHEGRLSSIQNILLAYLLEVDRICRKHKIKYFLGGGTLLGAIRHHGFIPWDDDADIMMLRPDYEKFCKIAPHEIPQGMSFQTNENDENCFYEFAKFRLDKTIFATGFAKEHKSMNNGLAFDIFCHDATANSKIGQKIHLAMTLFTRALVFNKWNNRKIENGSKIQCAITNFCKALFPIRFSLWLEKRTLKFFKHKKNPKYLYDGMGRNIYNGSFPASYLDEVIYVDFEGEKLPVPKDYDKYLTFLYGDYMELAPLSTRLGCHIIEQCDLGKYDGFKLNDSDK